MTSIRKFVFFVATVLALASGAALGADKTYTLVMSPASGSSPIAAMTAKFTNQGNSSFNSFTLTVPAGYTVTGAVTSSRGSASYSGGVVTVTNILLPTGSGNSVTVTLNGVTTSGASCATGVAGNWTATVWTGSSLTGNQFSLVAPSTTSTSISPTCYNVTPSSSGNGTISPATVQAVAANGTVAFTLTPNAHYHLAPVTGTCGGTLSGNTFTTAQVTGNCTVIANFAIDTFTVTPMPGANGSMTPATPQIVNYGSTTAFTVTPNAGYYTTSASGCGGSLSGSTFTTGPIAADCAVSATFAQKTLSIGSSPTSAAVNSPFNVTVNETPGGAAVTMGSDCGATATSSSTASSVTFAITIGTLPASGVCNLTFSDSADGYVSASLSNLPVYKGVLDCGGYDSSLGNTDFTLDPDQDKAFILDGGSGWGLRRGPNKDGSACVKVNYSCDLSGGNIATCTWDKASGQKATFKYVFVWNAVAAGANGWPVDLHPWVTWKPNPSATPGWPDWMVGLACVNDMFPALPTLPTALLPVIPNVLPYSDLTTNTYGPYQPFDSMNNAQMAMACIAQQGWTSVGTADGVNRAITVQWWTKVIDEADIRVSGP